MTNNNDELEKARQAEEVKVARSNDHEHVYCCQDCGDIQDVDHYANQRVIEELKKILSSFDGVTVNPESPAFKPFRQLILAIAELEAKQN